MRPDLVDLTNRLTNIEGVHALGITTNGIALKRKLDGLCEAGMTHLNVSLDTLQRDKFARITRRQGLERVITCIDNASKVVPNMVKVSQCLLLLSLANAMEGSYLYTLATCSLRCPRLSR